MTRRQTRWASALAALSFLFCAACASLAGSIEGVQWELESWTLSSLAADITGITATFIDGRISGFSGVNSFGADCRIGKDGSFEVGAIRHTKRAGPEPAMRAESAFFKLLVQARSWKVRGDALTLFDAAGNELLSFVRAQPRVNPAP